MTPKIDGKVCPRLTQVGKLSHSLNRRVENLGKSPTLGFSPGLVGVLKDVPEVGSRFRGEAHPPA